MTQQTELCFYHWDATSTYLGIIIDLFNMEMQPYHLMMPANTQFNQWHLYKSKIHSLCTHPGRQLTLEQVKLLIQDRLANIKSAFTAVDPDGVGLVNKEKFRQVLGIQLCVSQGQVDTLLEKVRGQ